MKQEFKSKDFLLILLYSPGTGTAVNEPISGRTRITKAVFLFKEEVWKDWQFDRLFIELPSFAAWNYGPYSSEVFADLEFFVKLGFIRSSEVEETPSQEAAEEYDRFEEDAFDYSEQSFSEYTEEQFTLNDRGVSYVEQKQLYSSLSEAQIRVLTEFKSRINVLSLRELLRYVYQKYPSMTTKSKIKDQFSLG